MKYYIAYVVERETPNGVVQDFKHTVTEDHPVDWLLSATEVHTIVFWSEIPEAQYNNYLNQ